MENTPVGERGWLGNPFVTTDHGGDYTREESIRLFGDAFESRLENDVEFRDAVHELAGDTLGGWCQKLADDGPDCHGEVIATYLNDPGTWVQGSTTDDSTEE